MCFKFISLKCFTKTDLCIFLKAKTHVRICMVSLEVHQQTQPVEWLLLGNKNKKQAVKLIMKAWFVCL